MLIQENRRIQGNWQWWMGTHEMLHFISVHFSTFVYHSSHAKILWLRETARASWRSPCCCTCWCFGDYLRGRQAARIGQWKITQYAHRGLWERPVLPGAALRRSRCCQAPPCGETANGQEEASSARQGWTSNGSWCMGIKGEMSGTVCVTFTWYMYIYMSCL